MHQSRLPRSKKKPLPKSPKPKIEDPSLTPLLKLYIFLTNLGIIAHHQEKKPDHPFEQVIVTLDEDENAERLDYVLQISFVEDLQAGLAGKKVSYQHGATLMFSMGLSVAIPADKSLDFYRLFSLINRILPVGYLGINEGHNPPISFFSYRLVARNPFINMLLIVNIIEIINIFVTQLVPEIQKLNQPNQTVEQVFENIEQVLIANARDLYKATTMHESNNG